MIGVPVDSSPLAGFDALLATVQMPGGVPVGTMGVGKSGAVNAAIFAAQILATSDAALTDRLAGHKRALADKIRTKSEQVKATFSV